MKNVLCVFLCGFRGVLCLFWCVFIGFVWYGYRFQSVCVCVFVCIYIVFNGVYVCIESVLCFVCIQMVFVWLLFVDSVCFVCDLVWVQIVLHVFLYFTVYSECFVFFVCIHRLLYGFSCEFRLFCM